MKYILKTLIILTLLVLSHQHTFAAPYSEAQRPVTDANIFGHVIDAETGEHLPFVNLIIRGTRIGTITDATGHFMLTNLPVGSHTLVASSLGYATAEVEFVAVAQATREVDVIISSVGIDLSEIVLTSSPTASGFRYQPDAVFLGEQLQRRSEASFGEMLNGQPGVAMRSFGSAPARPVIRGMDGDRILVLENGERMGDIAHTSADHSISLDPLVASRVEVVRGPASLLYGSSALGGVINIMTTDIPDQWDAGITGVVSGQGASMNNMGAGFGRITLGGDNNAATARFALRQAGNIHTPDGEMHGTAMTNYDGALGWGFNNGSLNGGLSLSFSDQTFGIPESPENPAIDGNPELRASRASLQGRFGRNLNGSFFEQAQLRFNASRFDKQEVEFEDAGNEQFNEAVKLQYRIMAFNSSFTLQHRPRGILARGAVGFNLGGHNSDINGEDIFIPNEQRVSLAAFTFQEIPLTNLLRLQFGVRMDFNHSRTLSNEAFPDVSLSRNVINYSGSLGLNFRPFEGIEIGGQFARSHRNPLVEELFANGPHLGAGVFERGNVNLRDEIGHGADVFMKITRPNVQFEIAGFLNDFRNYIIFQSTGLIDDLSGLPIFEYMGGAARLLGGEVSADFSITQRLSLNAGIDYVNGKRIIDYAADEHLPVIPPFRFNSQLEYDFGPVWIGADIQAVSTQSNVAPEELMTDGYTLLGFQAGYRLNFNGKHVIVLRVTNALDVRYRDHLSRIEDRNFFMPGRNINLTYRWFF